MKRVATTMQHFLIQAWGRSLARRTWPVTVITIISCAAFAAHAATSLVAADYLTPAARSGTSSPQPTPLAPPTTHRQRATAGQLVERNMFCASCAPAGAPGSATDVVLPPAVLIETSLGREPRATVRVVASEVQGSWGVGEAIPGLGRVDRIAPRWIELVDGAGRRGRLSLLELAETAAGRGSDPARSGSPPAATPWADRIRQFDEQTYEVDRDLVRELVTGAAKPGGARFLPMLDHGEVKGVRILGVTPASIPFALGLKTGDTLEAIDGTRLKDLNQLLDLYARLDQLSAVELAGTRAGKPLVRTLRLR
jgi:hypothetical protein